MKRSRIILVFGLVILFLGFVIAVSWDNSASSNPYYFKEDSLYSYNFTANLTDVSDFLYFLILDISWDGGILGPDHSDFYWMSWNDSGFSNSTSGVLNIGAINDNETGNFTLNVYSQGSEGGSARYFNFIINATNDAPNFTLEPSYNHSIPVYGYESKNISLVGSDEEEHYPLNYNFSINNCSFAQWSTRTNADCSLNHTVYNLTDSNSVLGFWNLTYNDVGVYNLTVCATDNVDLENLPLYRDSDYDSNKTTCHNTTLELVSSLAINAVNCTGTSWTEGDILSCTLNITTIGASDEVNISTNARFRNSGSSPHDTSWFYSDKSKNAENNLILVEDISVLLTKIHVGNWTINFSVDDGNEIVYEEILVFVDYIEYPVDLRPISDLTGENGLYESYNFEANISDDDLLIRDSSIKKEIFVVASNVSWVSVSVSNSGYPNHPYRTANVFVNHTGALQVEGGEGNYSVRINVTDGGGNFDEQSFVVEIFNVSAPIWDISLPDRVDLNLTEDSEFFYNFSMNVSDPEGFPISFYYEDVNGVFCSINSTNFNSNGVVDFVPDDCDVGYQNVTVIATNGMLNASKEFNFTIINVVDSPVILSLDSYFHAEEGVEKNINFSVSDDDFLIDPSQSDYYSENLTISLTFTNLTEVVSPISFNFTTYEFASPIETFVSIFTPTASNVGYYNVTVNVTDAGGEYDVRYFALNITAVNDAPVLEFVPNQSTTVFSVFYYNINATDEEDSPTLPESGLLNYTLESLTPGGEFLTINKTTGVINHTMNESLAGYYVYNISVNDTDSEIDWQIFSLSVHGVPNITGPTDSYEFLWDEALLSSQDFEVEYFVNNTNLSYVFYVDGINYFNSTDYSYSNLTVRDNQTFNWDNNSNFTWNFTPSYTDETYGLLKNLTLFVYNTEYPELNDTKNWKVNVTHTNQNITFSGFIPKQGPVTVGSILALDLSSYFTDADAFDTGIMQRVEFIIVTNPGSTNNVQSASSANGWTFNLQSGVATSEIIKIVAIEYDVNNDSIPIGNASSNEFEIEFIPPATVTVPRQTQTTIVKLQHFSLKLIVPQDIILDNKNYIEVPFSLQNTGTVDLVGISLSSDVLFNGAFSDDISIELEDTYIESLDVGQIENYTLKINANTDRAGKYKVTIRANVTSPKFSDWGDFFIELKKTNESEVEQILIFTEQFITDNPECLELTEVLNRAKSAYSDGDLFLAINLAEEVTSACEDAIKARGQIRYTNEGFIQNNFYYILFITLFVFVVGFVIYVYKRVRFNKYEGDYNLR